MSESNRCTEEVWASAPASRSLSSNTSGNVKFGVGFGLSTSEGFVLDGEIQAELYPRLITMSTPNRFLQRRRLLRSSRPRQSNDHVSAFTRVEVVVTMGMLALISMIVAPTLASNSSTSDRAVCWNNLRLVGRGVQTWLGDHDGVQPWRARIVDGGTYPGGLRAANAYYEYSWMSNELVTPKILACPADGGVKTALTWDQFRFGYQSSAQSYTLALDSQSASKNQWLASDRNLRFDTGFGNCSAGFVGVNGVYIWSTTLQWTNGAVHGSAGHVLLYDGAVEFTSTARLREIVLAPENDDAGNTHILRAR
jgi:hypothetical protein